ncbi:MAG: hypothetical protein KAG14_02350 [Mycoplasmataceae bacterium]|nr:hypothetical protein [Mycoplasmataceae bacterium]
MEDIKSIVKKNKSAIAKEIKSLANKKDIDTDSDFFNDSLKKIQGILQVKTGDVAGQYFSNLDDEWEEMSTADKVKTMMKYIKFEINNSK